MPSNTNELRRKIFRGLTLPFFHTFYFSFPLSFPTYAFAKSVMRVEMLRSFALNTKTNPLRFVGFNET